MTSLSPLLLPVIALLFFFLPGMAAVFAFAGRKSSWRHDDIHLITSSCGLSVSLTLLLLALTYLASHAAGVPFPFDAVPVLLTVLTAAFLIIAAFRGSLPGMRPRAGPDVQSGEEAGVR